MTKLVDNDEVAGLLAVADAYGAARGISRARVSTIVLKRGGRLDDLAAGGDIGTRTRASALRWFADNWPENATWPPAVPRPAAIEEG